MRNVATAVLLFALVPGSVWAQQKPPRVTSIRFDLSSGMCYGYCHAQLGVEPGNATLLNASWDKDKSKCPDLTVRADLSDRHWKELAQLIDREALFALPDSIGCPGCVDEVVESIEVRFSDHTKKAVGYNMGSAPKEIKGLSEKLSALEQKLAKEIHPGTRCR